MAEWKYTLDVKNEWQLAKRGEITATELAVTVLPKIKALSCFVTDTDLQDIAEELEAFIEFDNDDVGEFDAVWNELYDWADQVVGRSGSSIWTTKMCWVNTF